MKKISLALLAAAASITVAEAAAPFNGFYAGANLGFTQRSEKLAINGTEVISGTPVSIDHNKTKKSNGFVYGLMAGYGQTMNGFYLGAELSLNHDTAGKWQNHAITGTAADGSKGEMKVRVKWERSPVLGLTPRLGAVIGKDMLLYAKLGVELSRHQSKTQIEGDTEVAKSSRKTKVTFVPGFGFEKAFGNVLARIEYGYDLGAKRTGEDKDGANTVTASQKYTAHTVKLGVAWQF